MHAIVRDRIAVEPGALNLYLTRDWRATPAHDSFGHDVETAFLLVATPEPDAIREAAYFAGRLAADRMPLAGLVLNRVTTVSASALSADAARLAAQRVEPPLAELLKIHADLAEQAALSVANASRHLHVLRAARLVDAEKRGLYVEYRLADEAVSSFFLSLRKLAESRLAEIERLEPHLLRQAP